MSSEPNRRWEDPGPFAASLIQDRAVRKLRAVVAIPARNEAERIATCLFALGRQRHPNGRALPTFGVLILANNCEDATAQIVRDVAADLSFPIRCIEMNLLPERSTAGWARRLAMDHAAAWLEAERAEGAVLFSTDADSHAHPFWMWQCWSAMGNGSDAVAGAIQWDPDEQNHMPAWPGPRSLETAYAKLTARLGSLLDPRPHNPWPNHIWAWGASLAVTLGAYRSIGGLPAVALAEDRAFVAALEQNDFRVRHSLRARVWTSCRTDGRAPGGLADQIAEFAQDADALCDAALEPARDTIRRLVWRRRLRRLHAQGGLAPVNVWAKRLALAPATAAAFATEPSFGRFWQLVENHSPHLRRTRLVPRYLPAEVRKLNRALRLCGVIRDQRSCAEVLSL